jgi:hypothetical protein
MLERIGNDAQTQVASQVSGASFDVSETDLSETAKKDI